MTQHTCSLNKTKHDSTSAHLTNPSTTQHFFSFDKPNTTQQFCLMHTFISRSGTFHTRGWQLMRSVWTSWSTPEGGSAETRRGFSGGSGGSSEGSHVTQEVWNGTKTRFRAPSETLYHTLWDTRPWCEREKSLPCCFRFTWLEPWWNFQVWSNKPIHPIMNNGTIFFIFCAFKVCRRAAFFTDRTKKKNNFSCLFSCEFQAEISMNISINIHIRINLRLKSVWQHKQSDAVNKHVYAAEGGRKWEIWVWSLTAETSERAIVLTVSC